MHSQKKLAAALVLLFGVSSVFAAIGDEQVTEVDWRVEARPQSAAPESGASRVRETGEKACRQVLDTATLLGEKLEQIRTDVLPKVAQAGEQIVREVEPTLERLAPAVEKFADQVREMARELEESLREGSADREPKR